MSALGGLMTYRDEPHPGSSTSTAPGGATAAHSFLSPLPSSAAIAFATPAAPAPSTATTTPTPSSTLAYAAPVRWHRPLTASSSSSSSAASDSSLDSSHTTTTASPQSHVVLPPLSQHLSQPMRQQPAYPMAFVSHQCPVAQQGLAMQHGATCGYCRTVVQGYTQDAMPHQHHQPPPPSGQTWQQPAYAPGYPLPPPPPQQQQQPPSSPGSMPGYYHHVAGRAPVPHAASSHSHGYNGVPAAASYPPAPPYAPLSSPTPAEYAVAHTSAQNQCPQCGRVLGRPADLERHIESVHNRTTQFPCTYGTCDRRARPFNRWDHLRDHLRKVHGEPITKTRGPRNSRT